MNRRRASLLAALAVSGSMAAAPSAAEAASTCAAQQVTVTPLQSGVFYVDTTSSYLGSYVGYRVGNTGASPRGGLWVRLENFTGAVVAPANGMAATAPDPVAEISTGAAVSTYAYLKATGSTAAAQSHDVVVYDGRPGSGGAEVCRETQTISSVQQVIKASANKVTSTSISSTTATLGSTFSLTVNGQSGTIGAGISSDPGIVRFSPAVAADWPSSAFRLESVTHELPLGGSPFPDLLSRSNMTGASQDYTVTYTFRVVGATSATTPVVPVSNIASGTQVKHTDPISFSLLAPIPQVTTEAVMSVEAGTPGPYTSGTSVPLAATITNAGADAITIDEVDLYLPGTWASVAGSFERDGTPIADAFDAGAGNLRLVGPFTIAGNDSSTFSFSATAGTPGSSDDLTALALLDGGQIDSTLDLDDNNPARTTLTVIGPPVARDDSASAAIATLRTIDVLANDDLTGARVLSIETPPLHGTANVVDDRITYESVSGYSGPDAITYRVTTAGGTDTAVVTLNVEPLPAPPSAPDVTSSGIGIALQSRDLTVPPDGTVTLLEAGTPVTSLSVDGEGDYALNPRTGRVTFVPQLGFTGPATPAAYAVTDAFGQSSATGYYTPTVTAPPAPSPANLTSTGVGTDAQSQTLSIPNEGTVRLLDAGGQPVTSVTVPNEGTYALDVSTGNVTFLPEFGFAGVSTVAYRATDAYNQSGDATYRPSVSPPAAPTPANLSSTGVGLEIQSRTAAIPDGGTIRLLNGTTPTTTVTVAGQGVYTLDTTSGSGVITFTPVLGFAGAATPVTYQVTDAYQQTSTATYTPEVTPPPAPVATDQSSSGGPGEPQIKTLTVPEGGTVMLVAPDGSATTTLVVEGVGTYAIEPLTGVLRFTPIDGYSGTPPVIRYRLIDAYGQATEGAFTTSVRAMPIPAPVQLLPTAADPGASTPPATEAPPPACFSRRTMLIHWKIDRGVRVRRITITINGKAYKSLKGKARKARIDLRGYPAQLVTIRVTAHGKRTLTTTRTYQTCTPRRVTTSPPTLYLRRARR